MTSYANRSFWIDEYGSYTANEPLKEDCQVDIAIVGGGYTGLSTAYHLRTSDTSANVAVLESEMIGYGASGRNGGWVIPQFGIDPFMVKGVYGLEKAKQAVDYALDSLHYVEKLVGDLNLDCDFRMTGLLKLAIGKKGVSLLEKFKKQSEDMGHGDQVLWMDRDAIAQELDCRMVDAAIYEKEMAVIQPCKLVREWKRVAQDAGAKIYENTPAVSIDRSGNKILIKTPRGRVIADKIVLATNGYTHLLGGEIGKQVKRDQMPMTPVLHVTEKLSAEQWERAVSKSYQCPMHTAFGLYHGYTPTSDGRLVLWYFKNVQTSANNLMRPYEYDIDSRELAMKHLPAILPALDGVKIEQTWGGPMSVTMDLVPHLGYIGRDKRVILSSGCAGHGVSMSMLNGRTISELLLDQNTERTDLWFVKRKTRSWLPVGLGTLGVKGFVAAMRLEHRMDLKKTSLASIDD